MNIINLLLIKNKYFINFNFSIGDILNLELISNKKIKKFSGKLFLKNFKNFNLNFKLLKFINGFFVKKTIQVLSKNLLKIELYKKKKKKLKFFKKFIKF